MPRASALVLAVAAASVAAAAGCDDKAEEVGRKHEELAEKVDDVAAEARALQRELDEQDEQIAQLKAQIADLDRKLDTAHTAGARAPGRPTRRQPDPAAVYSVAVDGDPADGPADALVTIVEGFEYACPYCERVRATLADLRREYGDDLRIVRKHYIVHPQTATDAARAACAAHLQGRFAEMDELLWDKAFAARRFDEAHLETLAREARLDVGRWRSDMRGRCVDDVAEDQRELAEVGQGATPTFYINGRFLSGAQPIDAFRAVIDEELARAQARVAAGTPRRDYYRTFVVDAGITRFDPLGP
jgi:protein-disulfide isomerase